MNLNSLKKNWFVVLKSSTLKNKPIAVTLLEECIVVYRHGDQLAALKDQCIHRGIPLSKGKLTNNGLQCKYHGWLYNHVGGIAGIPGMSSFSKNEKCNLKKYDIIEKGNYIWIRLEKSETIPYIANIHNDYSYYTQSMNVTGSIVDVIENFLDPMHTHFIHQGLVRSGNNNKRSLCNVTINNIKNGYEAVYKEEQLQSGFISSVFGRDITESRGKIISPCVVELIYSSLLQQHLVITIHVTPTTNKKVRLFIRTYLRPGKVPFILKAMFLIPFQWTVGYQDKKILELQARSMNSEFRPTSTSLDFMRKYIINVINDDIQKHHSEHQFYV